MISIAHIRAIACSKFLSDFSPSIVPPRSRLVMQNQDGATWRTVKLGTILMAAIVTMLIAEFFRMRSGSFPLHGWLGLALSSLCVRILRDVCERRMAPEPELCRRKKIL